MEPWRPRPCAVLVQCWCSAGAVLVQCWCRLELARLPAALMLAHLQTGISMAGGLAAAPSRSYALVAPWVAWIRSQLPTPSTTPACDLACADVLVWAPGAGASQLPPQAGIPFGAGEDVYFVLNAQ